MKIHSNVMAVSIAVLLANLPMCHSRLSPDAKAMLTSAYNGDTKAVELLLAKDPSLSNAIGPNGDTALSLACIKGNIDVISLLLGSGADPNVLVHDTPILTWAVIRPSDLEVVKLLINNGAQVNIKDKWGNTPLHEATKENNKGAIKLLIADGADVNARCFVDGTRPYDYLGSACDPETANIFLQANIQINAVDKNQNTLLHYLVYDNCYDLVRIFINHGADTNVRNWKNLTPLDIAVNKRYTNIATLLRENGAKE